jgi:hypothetical protein
MARAMSGTFPGVRAKATGRPPASARPGTLLVVPPRARGRPLPARSPFCGLGRAVRLRMGASKGELFGDRSRAREASSG